MKKPLATAFGIIVLGLTWYLVSPVFLSIRADEPSPLMQEESDAQLETESSFIADAHDVSGTAQVITQGDQQIIRFDNFETINGPNLHVYLSKDLEATEYIDLGPIKATKGSANYTVPADIDLREYKHVLVWCVPFTVLFSHATIEFDA